MGRKLLSTGGVALVALAGTAAAVASHMAAGPRMGPATRISRPAFHGYYDGHKDTYLNTDVSSRADAKMMHVNYGPGLKNVPLATSPEIYLVEGRAAAGQLAVFGSEPGEKDYSPIWKETLLTWKSSATPVVIKSDTQVNSLETKGVLTEKATTVRLNCPIIKVGKG